MQQVEVDGIRLQAFALLIEITVEIVSRPDGPGRHLSGQLDLLPVAVAQRLAYHNLAAAGMVRESRIHIIDAVIDRMPDHPDSFGLIYISGI